MKKRFLSVLLCLCMVFGSVPVMVRAETEPSGREVTVKQHTHYLCGGSTCNRSGHIDESRMTTFAKEIKQEGGKLYIDGSERTATTGFYILSDGTYYLSTDLTLNGYIRIQGKGTLCLNGHSITCTKDGDVIIVIKGSTFTLTDCKGGKTDAAFGKITHAPNLIGRGVKVVGFSSSNSNVTNFYMYGGNIAGNNTVGGDSSQITGGGVYVGQNYSTFKMSGTASITNNEATQDGGGVYGSKDGQLYMFMGSSITARSSGGGVHMNENTNFAMSGGAICGNTATLNFGGGVCAYKSSYFYMTGGGIYMSGSAKEITVSGNIQITGNMRFGTKNENGKYTDGYVENLYLNNGITITVDGALADSAKLGVTLANDFGNSEFTSGWSRMMDGKEPSDYFISDVGGYKAALGVKELKLVKVHTHSWTYTASGDTITATCKNCEDNNGQDFVGGTYTITASDATYDGSDKTADVRGTGIFENVDMSISYSKYNATSGQFESTNILPAGAGKYMASITYSGVTAGVEYTIGKATLEAPADLTVSPAGSVGGKGKINGTTAGTYNKVKAMEYNTSATATTGWKDCSDSSTEVVPGTYYVCYKETDNYHASAVSAALTVKEHAHSGGNATCQKKAVCDGCGQEYGELGNHIFTETVDGKCLVSAATCGSKAVYNKSCSVCGVKSNETFENGEFNYTNHIGSTYKKNQMEASCYAEGYTGDIYCSTCNHEIEKGTVIAKNAHNPASVWTTDETNHWKECQTVGCGNIIDKAHHSGGEATCVSKAVCEICKAQYGDIDAGNHKHTEVRNAKDATCCEKGYTGDIYCTDCNALGSGINRTLQGQKSDCVS